MHKAWKRELERRVRDMDDSRRFMITAPLTKRHQLFYDVTSDTYAWNDARCATLFKRRAMAAAVARQLCSFDEIVECRVDRKERLVLASVAKAQPRRSRRKTRHTRRAQ